MKTLITGPLADPLSGVAPLCNSDERIIFPADCVVEIKPGYKLSVTCMHKEKVIGQQRKREMSLWYAAQYGGLYKNNTKFLLLE